MARYLSRTYRRRTTRNRKRIYIILAMLIIVVVYCVYRLGNHKPEETQAASEPLSVSDSNALVVKAESEPLSGLIGDVPIPITDTNPEVTELIEEAVACLEAKPAKIIEARDRLNEVLPMSMSDQQRLFVKRQLSKLADKWLFSRTVFPQDKLCTSIQVGQGELLSTIGKRFKVPYEILVEINNIGRPEALKAGGYIKVINGPFHARVYLSTFTMDLYLQNTFVKSYQVGLGREGRETPMGLWIVKPGGKLISPTWTDPDTGKTYQAEDPDYPLGSRWIALEGIKGAAVGRTGIAIHGTKYTEQIGAQGSRGCIRLYNGDAILIYSLLAPRHSQVEVVE